MSDVSQKASFYRAPATSAFPLTPDIIVVSRSAKWLGPNRMPTTGAAPHAKTH